VAHRHEEQLIQLTQKLLDCIAAGDWTTYQELCDPSLTAFEPEARGVLVHGLPFHKYYFDLEKQPSPTRTTIVAPHVRSVGTDAAVVSFIRLVQHVASDGTPVTARFEETRVWQRREGQWRHVHFHRSSNS